MRRMILALMVAVGLVTAGGLAPASSSAQVDPDATLIGQSVTACRGDARFQYTVVGTNLTDIIVDRPSAPGTLWAIVVLDIVNRGPEYNYAQGLLSVQDDRGRVSPWALFNGPDIYVEDELAAEYGVQASWEGVDVDTTQNTVAMFQIASSARYLILNAEEWGCGDAPALGQLDPALGIGGAAQPGAGAGGAAPARPNTPAAPNTPARPSNPALTLLGQSTVACKGELEFQFDVVDVEWRKTVVDRTARGNAMWAVVIADVTNLGPFDDAGQGLVKLVDERGREFAWRLFNGLDIYVEDEIAAEFGLRPSWDIFSVGITETTVLLFEVPSDARTLTLIPNNIGCGG